MIGIIFFTIIIIIILFHLIASALVIGREK